MIHSNKNTNESQLSYSRLFAPNYINHMSETLYYLLLIIVFCVVVPISLNYFSNVLPRAKRRKQIQRFISLYRIILSKALAEKKDEEYIEASKFYSCWNNWIGAAANSWIEEKMDAKQPPQIIAWRCLDHAIDGDLKNTLQTHGSILNHMPQDDNSSYRIYTIMKCLEDLQYRTVRGDVGLNSFEGAKEEYHIEQYIIDSIKRT